MDIQRLMALDPNIIQVYFDKVEELRKLRKLHNIEPEDEYNMDEKGFQMGQVGGEAVIVDKSQGPLLSLQLVHQNGSLSLSVSLLLAAS